MGDARYPALLWNGLAQPIPSPFHLVPENESEEKTKQYLRAIPHVPYLPKSADPQPSGGGQEEKFRKFPYDRSILGLFRGR